MSSEKVAISAKWNDEIASIKKNLNDCCVEFVQKPTVHNRLSRKTVLLLLSSCFTFIQLHTFTPGSCPTQSQFDSSLHGSSTPGQEPLSVEPIPDLKRTFFSCTSGLASLLLLHDLTVWNAVNVFDVSKCLLANPLNILNSAYLYHLMTNPFWSRKLKQIWK